LSTDEKLGADEELELGEAEEELDAPPEALPDDLLSVALGLELGEEELGEAEEELDAPPEALPDDLLSVALGLELDPDAPLLVPDEVLCAAAMPASAKSAAAVAVPTTLSIMCEFLLGRLGGRSIVQLPVTEVSYLSYQIAFTFISRWG
jgi:hypothetical protein